MDLSSPQAIGWPGREMQGFSCHKKNTSTRKIVGNCFGRENCTKIKHIIFVIGLSSCGRQSSLAAEWKRWKDLCCMKWRVNNLDCRFRYSRLRSFFFLSIIQRKTVSSVHFYICSTYVSGLKGAGESSTYWKPPPLLKTSTFRLDHKRNRDWRAIKTGGCATVNITRMRPSLISNNSMIIWCERYNGEKVSITK